VTEVRRSARFKLQVELTVRSKTLGLIPGFSIELSESGMSAILPVELSVGQTVELHINLPLGSVDVQACVRNRNAFRHGFEFSDHKAARKLINDHCAEVTTLPGGALANYWIVDSKNRVVFAKFGRRLTMADAERFATDLRNNPAFDPSFSELSDLTEVENPQIDFASAARFARYSDPFSHESKRAIVAPKLAMYETVLMYKTIRNDENIAVFMTVDKAKSWLGLSCVSNEGT